MRKTLMSLMVLMLMIPSIAVAAQPVEPVGTVTSGNNEVYRAYDNPNVDMDALAGILAFGSIHVDEAAASQDFGSTAEIFVESLRGGLSNGAGNGDYEFGVLEAVEIDQIGDESTASLLPFTLFGTIDGEYGIVAVRQGAWVQVLVGFGVGEVDVIPELAALATALEGRWPSDEPIVAREDGLRTGGIWDMMPLPDDLPVGFEIDEAFEEGPAPADGDTDPTGTAAAGSGATPSPAASPVVAATPESGVGASPNVPGATPVVPPESTPDTAPIIEPGGAPTPTPEPSPEAVDTAPEEPASTGDMNERLAPPIDLLIDIIIAQGSYTPNPDGSCSGSGAADSLTPGGDLSVQDTFGNDLVVASIDATGTLNYDMVLTEDVCYWRLTIPNVTAREEYVLATGGTVIGQFQYEDVATGEPGLVVIGAEGD